MLTKDFIFAINREDGRRRSEKGYWVIDEPDGISGSLIYFIVVDI